MTLEMFLTMSELKYETLQYLRQICLLSQLISRSKTTKDLEPKLSVNEMKNFINKDGIILTLSKLLRPTGSFR